MDPPRSSQSSSPRYPGRVNEDPGLRRHAPDPDVPEPPVADEVLCAVAFRHRPGDVVTLSQVVAAIAVTPATAQRVIRWATRNGAWPYLRADGPGGEP